MNMTNLKNNTRMNKMKSLYEAPTTDVLVVRFEGNLLTGSPQFGTTGSAGSDTEDENYGGF